MKNLKYSLVLIVFLITTVSVTLAQNKNIRDKRDTIDNIKNSKLYLYGEDQSKVDFYDANQKALAELGEQISVIVNSSFADTIHGKHYALSQKGRSITNTYSSTEKRRIIINTYSNATLTNAGEYKYQRKNGMYYVFRYIRRKDIATIFKNRRDKMYSYFVQGNKALNENRIGNALRYYYWSYVLSLTLPFKYSYLNSSIDSIKIPFYIPLGDKITSTLQKINFDIDNVSNHNNIETITVNCTYKGKKVADLGFNYLAEGIPSFLHSVNNGYSEISLHGEERTLKSLRLNVEYKYCSESIEDKEVNAVFKTLKGHLPTFKSVKQIDISTSSEISKPKEIYKASYQVLNKLRYNKDFYRKTMKHLLILIADKDYSKAKKYFTPSGLDIFTNLIQYGKVKVIPLKDTLNLIQLNDGVMVGDVPMSFYFPNSHRQFTENVVFTFNNKKMIDDISFALSNITINGILNHRNRFGSIKDKFTLIQFMENYKTAYCLKRLNYIDSIFSDNALIIVGKVLKPSHPIDELYEQLGSRKDVIWQHRSKREYIKKLYTVFHSNEFINIDFDSTSVKKVNGPRKIYGIQIAQHYYSTHYSDFGYLFLMIDLTDSLKPTIYVRTWQPKKNPDGSIYGLNDFQMN